MRPPETDMNDHPADASMHLLAHISRDALDPAYRDASPRRRRWWMVAGATLVVGLLFGSALGDRLRAAPTDQVERDQVISRIEQAQTRADSLRASRAAVQRENRELTERLLVADPEAAALQRRLDELAAATGIGAVAGPGVILTADDAPDGTQDGNKVLDVDVRQAVNGLWLSGAEAIAVNGHRLSSRTSIRGAGEAITVDYRSLARPYRIEAIGDPDVLVRSFPSSAGGAWWAYLKQNYGISYELSVADGLRLDGDPGLGLSAAERKS